MDKSIVLWIKITPKPEFFKEAKEAILEVIPRALEDNGCKCFSLHESVMEDDRSFYLYEIFDSQDAYNRYAIQPFSLKIRESFKQWLACPPSLIKLSKVR
jgi:quinol monooxygenase YgiN